MNSTSISVRKTANGSLVPDSASSVAPTRGRSRRPCVCTSRNTAAASVEATTAPTSSDLGPVQIERIFGDRRRDQRGDQHADRRQHHRRRQHGADALKPRSADRHRTGSAPAPPIPPDRWCGRRRSCSWPGPESPASMPISRNTSSSGAPKRSASRLDRIPAITRTAPSRMAMLTESREAMHLSQIIEQILAIASLSSPQLNANPFLAIAAMCPVLAALTRLAGPCRIDGIRCPACGNLPALFESTFA